MEGGGGLTGSEGLLFTKGDYFQSHTYVLPVRDTFSCGWGRRNLFVYYTVLPPNRRSSHGSYFREIQFSRVKILVREKKRPDMVPRSTKKVSYGIYGTQIRP